MTTPSTLESQPRPRSRGRPRSDATHQKILDATRELLTEGSFAHLRIEHVAARAGVSKAAIYRRWRTKAELAGELLAQLAGPHIAVAETGDTRQELLAAVLNPMHAVTDTPFGPVIRSVLSQIATDPTLGDPFRATVVQARRNEIARVIERGIARGDLRPDADVGVATELLVGPVYFRVMFGGDLDAAFATRIVDGCAPRLRLETTPQVGAETRGRERDLDGEKRRGDAHGHADPQARQHDPPCLRPIERPRGIRDLLGAADVAEVQDAPRAEAGTEPQPGLEIAAGGDSSGERDEQPGGRRRVDDDERDERHQGHQHARVPGPTPASDLGRTDVALTGSVLGEIGERPG